MWDLKAIIVGIIVVLCLGLMGWVYVTIITKKLATAALLVDKQAVVANASGFWAKLSAYSMHWKTVILAWIAVLAQAFSYITSDVLTGWSQLPWAQVVDQKVATWITIVCVLLIPVTHALGIKNAAETTPVQPSTDGA